MERSSLKVVPAKATPKLHPLAGKRLESPSLADVVFETNVSAASPAFVGDHRVFGKVIFPGTGYLEAVRAAAELGLGEGWGIEGLVIGEALQRWRRLRKNLCKSSCPERTTARRALECTAPA